MYTQRCRRTKPHPPHREPARHSKGVHTYGFDCPGRERGWAEQALEAAFPA